MNHKVGTDYSTVKFPNAHKLNPTVWKNLLLIFERLGMEAKTDFDQTTRYVFPSFITFQTIQEVVRNTCFVCGGLMKDSTAFQNTLISFEDFGNDTGKRGTTQSRVGTAMQIKVRKCTSCGHSHI